MKNKLKSKTIALIGIVIYLLGVILSAKDLQGNPRFPPILKLISDTGMLTVIIMVIVRLWKQARFVASMLMLSTILFFVLGIIQQIVPLFIAVLFINLIKLVFLIALFGAIIVLCTNDIEKEIDKKRSEKRLGYNIFLVVYAVGWFLLHTMAIMPAFLHWATLGIILGVIVLSIRKKWGAYIVIVSVGLHFFYDLSIIMRGWVPMNAIYLILAMIFFQVGIILLAIRTLREKENNE